MMTHENVPCLYKTVDAIACTAGAMGHRGDHVYPGQRCWYFLRTLGVPPIRCKAGVDGHDGPHVYPR